MKKMTILAVILALAIALTACGGEKVPEQSNATDAPAAPTETTAAPQALTLTSWNLSTSTWSSPNGATIHLSAIPNYHEDSHKAEFVVRLESDDIAVVPCVWDGSSYTASADLNAANGYCYYVLLTAEDGAVVEVAVNTPAAPTNEALIDMEAALESYCNITIEESVFDSGKLTLSTGKVQVKAPTITNNGEAVSCEEVVLVLSLNGQELGKKTLKPAQTDTEGLFEAALDKVVFEIPEMDAEQKAELTLNATLTNGQVLSAHGANWIFNEEGLMPVVG